MKRISFYLLFTLVSVMTFAQYAPAGDRIKTSWGENIDPSHVWEEYPRPIMERSRWMNLNGLWNYAIQPKGSTEPLRYEGEILVPFCIESSLSGVGKKPTEKDELWYSREFSIPTDWKNKHVLLNFGAVDWRADVWVNDIKVGSHTGGYAAFSLDITAALRTSGKQKLVVRVYDPTNTGTQPHGKQCKDPHGIWYTPVTGIWQTVWLEPVDATHIRSLRITPDIDTHRVTVALNTSTCIQDATVEVKVLDGKQVIATARSLGTEPVEVAMPQDHKLWSPDSPHLYDLDITVSRNGKPVDQVKSYVGMRKISMQKDANGIMRMTLNNRPLFHMGPLDQGWWPDGLYTAPSYEALTFDIDKTKDFGFNMIRKHVKVEPDLWYNYCDKHGIIVWQDMPNGKWNAAGWQNHNYFIGNEWTPSAETEAIYRHEWKEIMEQHYNNPCVCVWVPFNEGWGQFKTAEIAAWTKSMDPTRLVNPASGGNFFQTGDIIDLHNYPAPNMYLYDAQRVNVLGEYGGIGYVVKDHIWEKDRNWGYVKYNSPQEVTDEYVKYAEQLLTLAKRGFSAGVYTQTTDVEIEINGLMTYDRKVIKVDEARICEANRKLTEVLSR